MAEVLDPESRESHSGWSACAAGYFDACTMGLARVETLSTMRVALEQWFHGHATAVEYADIVERVRALYAQIVSVPVDDIAIGATVSAFTGVVAESVPDGAEVLCVEGDFSSIIFPFLQQEHRGVTVRHVSLERVADEVTDNTYLLAFSLIQSATGAVADVETLRTAAHRHGALLYCDTTQAAGSYPLDASLFDMTVCHSYKWLCVPRGVTFLTISPKAAMQMRPVEAGWYAGASVWDSCYGPEMVLASDARRFDTSPAWLSWAGAEPALTYFAEADLRATWDHNVALANTLSDRLGEPRGDSPILTLSDPHGALAEKFRRAGMRASSRAGRLRLSFHLWNTDADLDRLIDELAPTRSGTARGS